MIIESNIRAPVLLNLLNSLQKTIKCSQSLAFHHFSSTRLINSLKHTRGLIRFSNFAEPSPLADQPAHPRSLISAFVIEDKLN